MLDQEITLFDANGEPKAYIENKENQDIFLWDGRAVSYIYEDKVYGWNGEHIGWFEEGVMTNLHGNPVAYIKEKSPMMPKMEPMKSMKKKKNMKSMRKMARMKHMNQRRMSEQDFVSFLLSGIE